MRAMDIDPPASGEPGWSVRETPAADAAQPVQPEGDAPAPPAPPAWAPPPPPRASVATRLAILPGVLLLAAGAAAAVMLVRHTDSLTTPDSIAGERRLSGGQYDGTISAMQDLLRKVDPDIRSVVFAAYGPSGGAGVPAHLVFAESGVAQDPTTGLRAFGGMNLPIGAGMLGITSPTVAASGGETFTCFTASGGGLPQMTMCFWSDTSPANAGGVMCMTGADVHSCADYAAAARRAVLGT